MSDRCAACGGLNCAGAPRFGGYACQVSEPCQKEAENYCVDCVHGPCAKHGTPGRLEAQPVEPFTTERGFCLICKNQHPAPDRDHVVYGSETHRRGEHFTCRPKPCVGQGWHSDGFAAFGEAKYECDVCGAPPVALILRCEAHRTDPRRPEAQRHEPGSKVRIVGGAWVNEIGKFATVLRDDGQVACVSVHGEKGTLSLASSNLEAVNDQDVDGSGADGEADVDVPREDGGDLPEGRRVGRSASGVSGPGAPHRGEDQRRDVHLVGLSDPSALDGRVAGALRRSDAQPSEHEARCAYVNGVYVGVDCAKCGVWKEDFAMPCRAAATPVENDQAWCMCGGSCPDCQRLNYRPPSWEEWDRTQATLDLIRARVNDADDSIGSAEEALDKIDTALERLRRRGGE